MTSSDQTEDPLSEDSVAHAGDDATPLPSLDPLASAPDTSEESIGTQPPHLGFDPHLALKNR